jgi:ATP-dependent DNA ligase
MKADTGELPPDGSGWAYELKWDGMRSMAEVDGGSLRMVTSNGRDATVRFPELAGLASAVGVDAVLDGKVVALDEHGGPTLTVRTQTPQKNCGVDPVEVPLDPLKGCPAPNRQEPKP